MSKKLAVLFIHGMGEHPPDFWEPIRDRILKHIPTELHDRLVFAGAWWDDVTAKMQTYVQHHSRWKLLCWKSTHKFVIDGFGDATAYLSGYYQPNHGHPVYSEVHQRIVAGLQTLEAQLGPDAVETSLMVLAHSLGSVILTNYIWDCQHNTHITNVEPKSGFQKMETLTSLITYGSNIPLFLSDLDPDHDAVSSIAFPPPGVHFESSHWDNFFCPSDVLGWPLQDLWTPGHGPKRAINDIRIWVGNLLHFWNPSSHSHYDTSPKFLKHVATRVEKLLTKDSA